MGLHANIFHAWRIVDRIRKIILAIEQMFDNLCVEDCFADGDIWQDRKTIFSSIIEAPEEYVSCKRKK